MKRLLRVLLAPALLLSACHREEPTPTSEYWVFESSRTETEEALIEKSHIERARFEASVRWSNPIAVNGLLE